MQLQGMTDEQFHRLLDAVIDIQYLIVKNGGMATKSRVEDVLMARFELDQGDAHTLTNFTESNNRRDFSFHPVTWKAKRPEPQMEDWPEIQLHWFSKVRA